ncbi:DUF1127 domain-containing protein [Piscinibacter defluvii]|uniref:DUF1127 domain-containing protein n=1 Tax=Piscinibacter defluvii TaxID=1796922 RepID=UPI000FDE68C1|nr:DUF1127 domain-containing protein [Piscinibacter defluvii]
MLLMSPLGAVLRWLAASRSRCASLHDLDERTLADIGLHPSEIGSVEAEWRGISPATRRHLADAPCHA